MTDKNKNLLKGEKGVAPLAAINHPRGRQSVVQSLNDLLHVKVDGTPRFSQAQLQKIVSDPSEPPSRVLAARRILSACRDGTRYVKDKHGNVFPAGSDPEPGRDFDRICDRLEGKPMVRVEHESGPQRSAQQVQQELLRLVAKHPQLLGMLGQKVEAPKEIIDGETTQASEGQGSG
jgi:hypothetical protein